MADNNEGTDDSLEGCSDWYIVKEAECKDDDPIDKCFEEDTDAESYVSDLVDDAAVDQGNILELFQMQEFQTGLEKVQELKRKLNVRSPKRVPSQADVAALSPQLQKVSITPKKKKVKKLIFEPEDSGVVTNEAEDDAQELPQVESTVLQDSSLSLPIALAQSTPFSLSRNLPDDNEDIENIPPEGQNNLNEGNVIGRDAVRVLMKTLNVKATILAKFKLCFGVSFIDLTRSYKSNKTMSRDWVIAIFGVSEESCKSAQELLQAHCDFVYLECGHAGCAAGLLELKNQKCRDTLIKLLKTVMTVNELQVLAEPPRSASTVSALFWFKRCTKDEATCFGNVPLWVMRLCSLQHQQGYEKPFCLTEMVQWALDNDYEDESVIAFNYAMEAELRDNARAFLKSTSQPKLVRDCSTMVRHYKRAQMKSMSVSAWIHYKCHTVKNRDEEDWRHIANFLRYQGIHLYQFVGFMQNFLKGKPKKSCMVLYGPPNTGKSLFAMSLIHFLQGKVITYANCQSHFWLQPLLDARFALLDDATHKCWSYIDIFLRGALDGNVVCLDSKHKNPAQVKFPPLIITTNVDVQKESSLQYLLSRLHFFNFAETLPIQTSGEPRYELTEKSWRSFFARFWVTLDLSDQEEEDGESPTALRLHTGSNT